MAAHTTTEVTTPDKTNFVDTLKNQPMELKTNNRLYTSATQRDRLGIDTDNKGRGTKVRVRLRTIDRNPQWDGQYEQNVFYSTDIRYYGAIHVPQSIVDELGLTVGDNVRTDVTVIRRPNENKNRYSQ